MMKEAMIKAVIAWTIFLFAFCTTAQEHSEKIWIDVRSPQEYKQQHLDAAINIPFMQIMGQITEVTTDKQASIHLYCTVGDRAEIAKQILENMGYENVVNEGGLKDIKQ